jgi:selenide,water dikinase
MSPDILGDILKGSQDAVLKSGAVTLGGHTFQSAEVRYGIAITGRIDPKRIYTNSGAKVNNNLILTKPLGTGTIINCAVSRGSVPEKAFNETITSMKTSNASAAKIIRKTGCNACTDITGFGFIGHCSELAVGSSVGIEINAASLPVFPLVRELIMEGVIDGSHKMNMNSFENNVRFDKADPVFEKILYNSETSGGLLISAAPDSTDDIISQLHNEGLTAAAVIGKVVKDHPGVIKIKS